MKKRLVLGDVHGHIEQVKYAYEKENPDEVIILGDYFDSFVVKPTQQMECMYAINAMRKIHEGIYGKGTFITVMGNHDFHYLTNFEKYSGWNPETAKLAKQILQKMDDDNQLPVVYIDRLNKTIYSHAGVSMSWMKGRCNCYDLNEINTLPYDNLRFTYQEGGNSFGSSKFNSPIWIRPSSLLSDMYADKYGEQWTQVVGHTHTYSTNIFNDIEDKPILYVIDCLINEYIVETFDDHNKLISREIVSTERRSTELQ